VSACFLTAANHSTTIPMGTSLRRKLILSALGLSAVLFPALTIPWFGARRLPGTRSYTNLPAPYLFPPGFLWGTATAAYQIETTQDDDWAAFERDVVAHHRVEHRAPGQAQPGHIHKLTDFSEEVRLKKTDFDARIESDLAMAAAMKHSSYRFSISWSRLFPRQEMTEPDPAGIAYYQRIFAALDQHRLKPAVTLFHFVSPTWFWQEQGGKRGWERADALIHFERFVAAVVKHFGGRAELWCTLNEPMVYVYAGYLDGTFPPLEKRSGPPALVPVLSQLLRAHALAYRLLKEDAARRGKSVQVGIAQHVRAFQPLRNHHPLDRLTAQIIDQAFVWDFLDALHSGQLRSKVMNVDVSIPGLAGTQDYVGLNYYGRFYVKSNLLRPTKFEVLMHDPNNVAEDKPNELGWASYPEGFRLALTKAHQRYHLPLYVLENGTADSKFEDSDRQRLLVEHLREMYLAQQQGVDIRGYFHWSLFDNFEWAEGFTARFGLTHIDYQNHFHRTPRPSAALYTRIIENNGLDAALLSQYGPWPQP
jgi:beta-glucosidase